MKGVRHVAIVVVALLALASLAVATQAELIPAVIDDSLLESVSAARAAVDSAAVSSCGLEPLRRIALCQKVVRTFLAPEASRHSATVVPFATAWSSTALCKSVMADFPTVQRTTCESLASHVFAAAGSNVDNVLQLVRQHDIHDACLTLLSTVVKGVPLVSGADEPKCTLASTGGVTGLRVLFLHGMGRVRINYRGSQPNYVNKYDGFLGRFNKYWNVEATLDGIADVRYFVSDTVKRGWSDSALQREYCDAIALYNPHVIFTHSLANNIIAASIANGVGACTRINKQSGGNNIAWFSSQAPWLGSPVAEASVTACADAATGLGIAQTLRNKVFQKVSPCGGSQPASKTLVPSFRNLITPGVQLQTLKSVARAHAQGAMCGVASAPLTLREAFSYEVSMWFMGAGAALVRLVNWGADRTARVTAPFSGNDGLVPFQSCDLGEAYNADPASPYYVGAFSHYDGTCMIRDIARNGLSKQPCTWYFNRVSSVRASRGLASAASNVAPVSTTTAPAFAAPATYAKTLVQINMSARKRQDVGDVSTALLESLAAEHNEAENEAETETEVDAEAEADADVDADADAESEAAADVDEESA